jgi:hypothetical protein
MRRATVISGFDWWSLNAYMPPNYVLVEQLSGPPLIQGEDEGASTLEALADRLAAGPAVEIRIDS